MKKKERACFFLIGLLAVILVVAICIIPHSRVSSPKKTVERFIVAFEQRDADEMLKNIAPYEAELIRAVMTRLGQNEQIQAAEKLIRYLLKSSQINSFIDRLITIGFDYRIVSEKIDGDFATVTVQILGEDEMRFLDFQLVKIDNQWYIEYFTVSEKTGKTEL